MDHDWIYCSGPAIANIMIIITVTIIITFIIIITDKSYKCLGICLGST